METRQTPINLKVTYLCKQCNKEVINTILSHQISVIHSECECCGASYTATVFVECPLCGTYNDLLILDN